MNFWRSWFTPRHVAGTEAPCPRRVLMAGQLTMSGDTHVGRARESNEDALHFDPACGLAMVADGLGGHAAGERASALAIAAMRERLTAARLRGIFAGDQSAVVVELFSCFRQVNHGILLQSLTHHTWAGMGCTIVVALFDGYVLHVAHLGDSRAYLLRNGTAQLLTRDHSVAELLYAEGKLSTEDARHHPRRNQLTACLGTPQLTPPPMRVSRSAPAIAWCFAPTDSGTCLQTRRSPAWPPPAR